MLQKEIQNIISFNFAKIKDLNDRFQLYDLQNAKVHPAIVKYILSTIDYQIQKEKKFIQKNSKFDYSGEKIEKLFKLISKEVKKEKEFSSAFIKVLIEEAVKFNVGYLTKPNSTLTNFVFEDNKELPYDEIFSKLKFVYYYKYIVKLVLLFLEKKKVKTISRKEFAHLLNKIEQVTKKNHLQNLINSSLNSIVNFFDQTNSEQAHLPFDAVQMFLEDKELSNFSQRLQLKYELEKPDTLNFIDIENLFKSDFDGIEISESETRKLADDKIRLDEINFSENQESSFDRFTLKNQNPIVAESEVETYDEYNISEEAEIPKPESAENLNVIEEKPEVSGILNSQKSEENENVKAEKNTATGSVSEIEIQNEEETSIDILSIDEKPDVKKLIKNLIDVNNIYDSLIKKNLPFENFKIQDNISLTENVNAINLQIDVSNISEEIIVDIPSEEEYIGIINDRHIDLVEYNDEEVELLNSEQQPVIENDINEKVIDEIENEIAEENFDLNNSIDEIINDSQNEEEFQEYNTNISINELDNDEKQKLENLLDEKKLKLSDNDEITEVFSDLNYLENSENDEKNLEIINKIEQSDLIGNINYREEMDNTEDEVKVIYSTFNELISSRNMSNIIETIFDYDMEDFYGIAGKISNAFNEKEALELTNDYCKNNHVDIFHNDVIVFKTYITEYFSQS